MTAALPKRHEIRDAVKGRGYSGKFSSRGQAWYTKASGSWTRQIGFAYDGEAVSVIYKTDSVGQEPHFVGTLTITEQELGDIGTYVGAIERRLHHAEGRIN